MGIELTMPLNYYALATAFSVHIFLVAMMFATMPWTKFGHAIYMYIWQLYDRYRTWKGVELGYLARGVVSWLRGA